MYKSELASAILAVKQAAIVCQSVQCHLINTDTLKKEDQSPVTVADFASQAIVCKTLKDTFPNDLLVGEEDATALRDTDQETLRNGVVKHVQTIFKNTDPNTILNWIDRGNANGTEKKRYWTLDPIDGTKGFLRNQQYAIALALIENGQVVLGVLGCPRLEHEKTQGLLLWAIKNQGAWRMPINLKNKISQPIAIHPIKNASSARFCESVESAHSRQDQASQIASALGIHLPPVRMDSQAKYATLAQGKAEIYLRLPTRIGYQEKIWDHAAGMLILEEAGGLVTDIHGQPLNFNHGRTLKSNSGVIASAPQIHRQVLDAVASVLNK